MALYNENTGTCACVIKKDKQKQMFSSDPGTEMSEKQLLMSSPTSQRVLTIVLSLGSVISLTHVSLTSLDSNPLGLVC